MDPYASEGDGDSGIFYYRSQGELEKSYVREDGTDINVSGGTVQLTVRNNPVTDPVTSKTHTWSSPNLSSKYTFSMKYGYMEARIKLPYCDGGLDTAFWTMPSDGFLNYNGNSAEFDLMECYDYGDSTQGNAHVGGYDYWPCAKIPYHGVNVNHTSIGLGYNMPGLQDGNWHTYACEWTPSSVKYYVDGVLKCTGSTSPAGFMHLELGSYVNRGNITTPLPFTWQVDYVRCYQPNNFYNTGNLLANSSFETPYPYWDENMNVTCGWRKSGTIAVEKTNVQNMWLAEKVGINSSLKQYVYALKPGTTYRFSAWVKSEGSEARVGVKDFGGTEVYQSTTNPSYTRLEQTFTTGASNTSATVYLSRPNTGSGSAYFDNCSLVDASEPVPTPTPGPETIWGSLNGSSWGSATSHELGTKFQSSAAGNITKIRVYAVSQESGSHTARIWNNSNNSVIGGPYTFACGGSNGWYEYTLPSAVAISADTEYTVSVSTGTDLNKNMAHTTAGGTSAGNNGNHLSTLQTVE